MNELSKLSVFNTNIISVYTTDTGEKVVIGRELHEKLKIDTPYTQWFERMCGYGFLENQDYSSFSQKSEKPQGGRPSIEHFLTLDMAKHISMIQRTPEGKAIRDKLIELDTNIESLSPELRLLINLETNQKQQQKALQDTNKRLDNIGDIIALDTHSWREDAKKLIVRIAQKMGGNEYIRDVNTEIYRLIDKRGGKALKTRLTNKRRRMADEGICKSRRDKLTIVDVIADEKALIEIYVAIVKEMAVKYGVDTLLAILTMYEQELTYKLFLDAEIAKGYYVKFNESVILQAYEGDNLFRYDATSGIDSLNVSIIHTQAYWGA